MNNQLFTPDQMASIEQHRTRVNSSTCSDCKHMIRHSYNNNIKYCTKQQQQRTSYGYKKVKSRDEACFMFELR